MSTWLTWAGMVTLAACAAGVIFALRSAHKAGKAAAQTEARADQKAAEVKAHEAKDDMLAEGRKIEQELDHADEAELRERLKQWAPFKHP